MTMVLPKFRVATFQSLRGVVSTTALQIIYTELGRVGDGVMDVDVCGCILRHTMGLPCAHELSEYVSKGMPIPLELVDAF